jgi:hypothetical protein
LRVERPTFEVLSLPTKAFVPTSRESPCSHSGKRMKPCSLLAVLQCLAIAAFLQAEEPSFEQHIKPFLNKYCHRCHNADDMQSGIRVDQLSTEIEDRQIPLLNGMQKQVADGVMPPEDEPQPTEEEKKLLDAWIAREVHVARSKVRAKNGIVRRLTVAQYRNTLRDLLGIMEDLTDSLPPDAMSKDGFTNNAQVLALSPLQVETYFDIADKALNQCMVDEAAKPEVQCFRMEFGAGINHTPCPDNLVLGALSELLPNTDFVVTEPKPDKSFDFTHKPMRVKYDFIEGYAGNDTVREWRKYDSIYHSVFACVRGTPGYPKGRAWQSVPGGMLLRPAIPSPEIFGESNTYGPMANFKISLRELPDEGNFRVTVKAAKYSDGLLLDKDTPPIDPGSATAIISDLATSAETTVTLPEEGVYQVDVHVAPGKPQNFSLQIDDRHFSGQLDEPQDGATDFAKAFLVVRLSKGERKINVGYGDVPRLKGVVFHKLSDDHALTKRFTVFEKRAPTLGVHVGLRRDCGSTLTQVGEPVAVPNSDLQTFTFTGAINDFPAPAVEKDNVNYLAGIREIAVRSEYTDGRDMPRMVIQSIEFEGPLYESWPPETHRRIFIDSANRDNLPVYAKEILTSFATRAFRRPVSENEVESLFQVWKDSYESSRDFKRGIHDALLVALTSPQFLFLIEKSDSPEGENLDPHELASKLSYFLWNAPPDAQLLELADKSELHSSLDSEVDRLMEHPRFGQFLSEFTSQWLSLDKLDVVATDAKRYPTLTRDTKLQLRQEPVEFLRHVIEHNLPVRTLMESDFLMANEAVASYYGLADQTENGFRFVPVQHDGAKLGGILTQAGILAGLSDGRESNPVKRGAWLARKMIAEPPDDPPPNVPKLPEDQDEKVTLRQKLETHRNQKGCAKCHGGIDPWGLPLESFDAGGLKKKAEVDTASKLPDGTEIANLNALKKYLANDRIDQVAFSFLKHVSTYASGRSLTYNELQDLREQTKQLQPTNYKTKDLIRFVIKSDVFLKK